MRRGWQRTAARHEARRAAALRGPSRGGTLLVEYNTFDDNVERWTTLQRTAFSQRGDDWRRASFPLPGWRSALLLRFSCSGNTASRENFCAIDSAVVSDSTRARGVSAV